VSEASGGGLIHLFLRVGEGAKRRGQKYREGRCPVGGPKSKMLDMKGEKARKGERSLRRGRQERTEPVCSPPWPSGGSKVRIAW